MLIKFIISHYKKSPLKMLFGFLMLVAVDIAQLLSPRIVQRAIDYIITTYTTAGNNYSYLGKFALQFFFHQNKNQGYQMHQGTVHWCIFKK